MDYFLLCIAARLLLAWYMYKSNKFVQIFVGAVASVWTLMTLGIVRRDHGREAGGRIWWKHMRPFHAGMYAMSLYYSTFDHEMSALILIADVAVGTIVRYDYRNKSLFCL